jgi:membrane fusion protein (multidrug efflux system)
MVATMNEKAKTPKPAELRPAEEFVMQNGTAQPAPASLPQTKPNAPSKSKRRLVLAGVLGLGLVAGGIAGVRWYLDSLRYVSTDDAFVDGHLERVAPQVAGRVVRVVVQDNQEVKAGDVLVEIDPADYQSAVASATAQLATANAEIEQAKAQRALADAQVVSAQADQRVADAQVAQAQASVESAKAVSENAAAQAKRYEGLNAGPRGAISQQELDNVRTELATKVAALAEAQSRMDVAVAQQRRAAAAVAQANAGIASAVAASSTGEASVQQANAKLERARLDLERTKIVATTSGRVTKRTVDAGNYVQPGQALLAIVGDDLYITANLKETQLEGVQRGRRVSVKVDALPGQAIHGDVNSVMAGTGAAFSLLPPENATGNYVKVVQRVPVKIDLELTPEQAKLLSIGMSVEPKISLHEDSKE